MDNILLPVEKACEPVEEAHQPFNKDKGSTMSVVGKKRNRNITFAETDNDEPCSQSSSAYKDALSQPATGISHRQKLLWLQKRRGAGLWAECDDCKRWRYLPHILANHELPKKWYCRMNPDRAMADCAVPEAPLRVQEEEDLIHSVYSCGSVVWADLAGWPTWPAMVDDCPDNEQFYWLDGFSDIPTHYNVVFFDAAAASRAWIAPESLKPYEAYYKKRHNTKDKKIRKRLEIAMRQAEDALSLPVADRLEKYSFIARYPGNIVTPTVTKKQILKQQRKLEKKFNVAFPVECSSGSEDEILQVPKKREPVKQNVIIVGTPKRLRPEHTAVRPKRLSAIVEVTIDNMKPSQASATNFQVLLASQPDTALARQSETALARQPETASASQQETSMMDISKISDDTANGGKSADVFKEPDSMMVQRGSASVVSEDKDETVLIPESQTQAEEDGSNDNDPTYRDFQVRVSSPSSDDFEF